MPSGLSRVKTPRIVGMQPVAEAGFPSVMCPVIFLEGCNFKCPYCLNADLVNHGDRKEIPLTEIESYISDNGEDNILISGGEPCLHPALGKLVDIFRGMGVKVRLSTNGSRPGVLEDMIFKHRISFVAMDLKTDLWEEDRWSRVITESDMEGVMASFILMNHIADKSHLSCGEPEDDFTFEFRTTLYPPLVGEKEIDRLASMMSRNAVWYLQQFRPREGLLGSESETVSPYCTKAVDHLADVARKKIRNVHVRWP